jgi:Na+/H+ antiporter NhaD/arsenite permease-like protein
MATAIAIFAITYLAVAGQRLPYVLVDRPAASLCGAVAMVVFGVLSLPEAYQAISWDTITLLLGMMVIAAYLMEAAFFRTTAWHIVTRMRSARTLLVALVLVSGLLSALLVNDTVCLMFTPLVVAVVNEAELPPLPYLLGLASATNIGGVVTFTGNPQNMIVGMAPGAPSYLEYLRIAIIPGVLCLVANAVLLLWLFRRELPAGPLRDRAPPKPYFDRKLALKGLAALALFVTLAAMGRSLAGSALASAALLILVARTQPRAALGRVDWILLLFFAGLFVVVAGVAKSGALAAAIEPVRPHLERGDPASLAIFALLTVVGSNLISNVPFVLVAVHWVPAMREPRWGYVVLAFASTLAGNLTIFGSVANLIVFETAGPRGKIGFLRFLRYGAIITAVTLTIALATLAAERSLGF